tara:strand:+ start:1367 stop:2044 length:678 start_codon:yes stop_codon:yes gene_type:complete
MSKAAPWSFSRIKSFEQCPKQFYHEKILKEFPFVQTQAILYGNHFHKAAEDYIGNDDPLPERFSYAKKTLDALKGKRGVKLTECRLGVTKELKACGFYDEDVWFRGIADLIIVDVLGDMAWVIDYKTGKSSRYADKGQLELMALSVFAHYTHVTKVRAGLLFVVCNDLVKDTYMEYDKSELWDKWVGRYDKMAGVFEADVWNPKPSGLCHKHCPVTECAHNGANR